MFLFQLYAASRADEMEAWGLDAATREMLLHMQWQAQRQSYNMQFPQADHLIVWAGSDKVGKVAIDRADQQIRLVDLIILPAFQRRGIATRLLQELQQEAAQAQKQLCLSVLRTNPAKQLYERLGFRTTDEDDVYAAMVWEA